MTIIRFSLPFDKQQSIITEETSDFIDKKALILYPYFVQSDKNGNKFDITAEFIDKLYENYNESVKKKWGILKAKGKPVPIYDVPLAQNRLDHSPLVQNVVGHVVGKLERVEAENGPQLFATLRVRGKENIEKVKNGIFESVSVGFDAIQCKLEEVSWVCAGALPEAGVQLSQPKEHTKIELQNYVLSQINKCQTLIEEKRLDFFIENRLNDFIRQGKIFPVDKIRLRKRIDSYSPKQKTDFLEELGENLSRVVTYGKLSKNEFAISVHLKGEEEVSNKKESIADKVVRIIELKKGKGRLAEDSEEDGEDSQMSSGKKKKFLSKKDIKHALSLEKEEAEKYLSLFSEPEDEKGEEEEEDKKKFSRFEESPEFIKLKSEISDLQNKFVLLSSESTAAIQLSKEINALLEKDSKDDKSKH